jgi:uncharacterized protein
MRLRIRDIERERSIEIEETLPAGRFALDTPDRPELSGPVQAKMKAEIQDGAAWAWVEAKAKLTIACARCLERYEMNVRPFFDVETPVTEEFMDVDDDIRQNLLLALPAQPLCSPQCKGLCTVCGKNLNKETCGCPSQGPVSAFDSLKNLKLN